MDNNSNKHNTGFIKVWRKHTSGKKKVSKILLTIAVIWIIAMLFLAVVHRPDKTGGSRIGARDIRKDVSHVKKSALGKEEGMNAISEEAVKVKFGFYPVGIYDLDPSNGSFVADFYAWMIYPKSVPNEYRATASKVDSPIPIERLEAVNGEGLHLGAEIDREEYTLLKDTTDYGVWFRVRGKFYHNFDIHQYPFDKQELEIQLENPVYPASNLKYSIANASSYDSRHSDTTALINDPKSWIATSGWDLDKIEHLITNHTYKTDWGIEDPIDNYSQNVLRITLRRHSWEQLSDILLPLIATMILTTLIFFLSIEDLASAIEICVIMFIGVVEQQYGFIAQVPHIGYFMTVDYYFLGTYFYIALCLIMVLAANYCSKRIGGENRVKLIYGWSRVLLPVAYLIFIAIASFPMF